MANNLGGTAAAIPSLVLATRDGFLFSFYAINYTIYQEEKMSEFTMAEIVSLAKMRGIIFPVPKYTMVLLTVGITARWVSK